jgi:hypothetical protein
MKRPPSPSACLREAASAKAGERDEVEAFVFSNPIKEG